MELIFNEVNYKSNSQECLLNNITYTFKNGVTFVNGLSGLLIKKLLFQELKLKSGYVCLDSDGKVYDVSYLSNNVSFEKNNLKEEILYLTKLYNLKYKDVDKRLKDSLLMANLNYKYLEMNFADMSLNELKKCFLVVSLYLNTKIFIFDYFEKQMSSKDIEYLKKLVYKLSSMYNKNIIICSNNIDLFLNIIKNIVIFKDGNLVFNKSIKEVYDDELYKYIDEPKIINFIKYLDSKNHKFDHYIDIKELLKAIYRDVENK